MFTSKVWSWLEVFTNTMIGMYGSWLINVYCITYAASPKEAATVTTLVCTIWSILRSYVVRRAFARLIERHGIAIK